MRPVDESKGAPDKITQATCGDARVSWRAFDGSLRRRQTPQMERIR